MTYIGDADDPATVLEDARIFFSTRFAASDDEQAEDINNGFPDPATYPPTGYLPPYWWLNRSTTALIHVYDLVAALEVSTTDLECERQELADRLLRRLRWMADALLTNRDDKRGFPEDPFRDKVMPAWGGIPKDRGGQWNTDVGTSAIFAYAMAAFAHRVARNPQLHAKYGDAAVGHITATLETFEAFRPELHLTDSDPHAYFRFPEGYRELQCHGNHACENYRSWAGRPLPYNLNLSMMKALAEVALAADSTLYRNSADATAERLQVATQEAPLLIAKNVAYFADHLRLKTLSDATPYFEWDYRQWDSDVDDTGHADFELASMAVVLANQIPLNELLARAGRAERIPNPSRFAPFANTFLRKVWRPNYTLSEKVDGSDGASTVVGAGFIPWSQFDPWVWKRARDTVFHRPPPDLTSDYPDLTSDNYAALLRYRRFNKMKFLTEFAGQNWLITPAATAVGEPPPSNIHAQKWLLVLSGVAIADFKGDGSGGWNRETVSFTPDMAGPDSPSATSGPLNWAISRYSIPRPSGSPGVNYLVRFSIDEWTPFVSLSAIFNQGQSINSGHAVEVWRPNHFGSGTDVLTGRPVNNVFSGVNADVAVRDNDAWILRLSYHITLIGKVVFVAPSF